MPVKRIANRFVHSCELSQIDEKSKIHSPYDTCFQSFCHGLRKCLTIAKNVDSSTYFRSLAAFNREKNRHLLSRKYRRVIHPFSNFARREDLVVSFLWFTIFVVQSYVGSFFNRELLDEKHAHVYRHVLAFANLLLLCDVVLRFFVGYLIDATRTVILDHKSIVKNYLKTYFIFDFGAGFSFLVFYIFNLDDRAQLILYELHTLRIVRVRTILKNLDNLLCDFNVRESIRIVVLISFIGFLSLHTLTCAFGLIPVYRKVFQIQYEFENSWLSQTDNHSPQTQFESGWEHTHSSLQKYLHHLSMVLCHFVGCAIPKYKTADYLEMLILAWITIFGLIFYVYVVAKVLQLFGVVNISETKFEELKIQSDKYMRRNDFPGDLRKRVNDYYDYKFDKKFFSEQKILDSLSEHLRMEVLLYSCRNLIEEVQIFKGLSRSAIGSVLALLKQEVYVANDVILEPDERTGDIYFILYGTCAIELISGKEVMHIEDGDYFGIVDMETATDPSSIVSLEVSEVYKLERKDIKYCCKCFPEIKQKLEKMALHRMRKFNQMMSLRGVEDETTDDIIDNLRKGRILHRGIHRLAFL
ncbi:Potassium/sodium hyperpolarization-activated cyclic nucleotide-gated channel 2-like Protein [Tribolium castaneum]|uniref:Potassium/sodium hyperpolarization-activated cyclic nucleotide-gated channel 2-like Protein n=1 Tax=Tribolium castaneum TaxID=7070 RepID=D2A3R6_TRICA|nr:PREDICTED: potassium/sodium hyperpolarization-activated cyclic nucleotide-gated channel 2 [Tribolium castaneum]EFA05554.1 Potassium/sodium hyperpolarization-activated cyclic nucleotide-gated channel 2-like Protein [Tribolium castaneum]|eukprot:XP_008194910.1 PREDICTED: potassium/sodium hyperpolarization-activated cyclic nucleotide-gated channel 2 [Tribolium castaneum]